ncbi:DNA primase family protein [Tautonia rosea]|uniref:DNA primase family protein n=1 Tax=Tautonia rosea TaxID=2728037 RepID=UPI00147577E6|nr:phage/plasmid primase, P4 family [Tautonia rosea]
MPSPKMFSTTDLGNAERLAHWHGEDIRWVVSWRKFLVFTGKRWELDYSAVERFAKLAVRRIYSEAACHHGESERKATAEWAKKSESLDKIRGMISLVASEEGIPIRTDVLDRDPWALNVLNGTLDLRTGTLGPHRREDVITKLAPVEYDPDAECPLWEATLERVFNGDETLIGYWQRLCGYVITGDVSEQALPILYGTGANGKSTLLNVLLDLLGPDYSMKAPPDFIMARRQSVHPTERADLFGRRLVVAIETSEGGRMDETLVKELTGSDKIRARRMREDFWEFSPTHKLMLCTNHKPEIRGTDHAIWRRLKLVPFLVRIPEGEQDRALPLKLSKELPGILAWCVRGCLLWQEHGLAPPDAVTEATTAYRAEQDVLGSFLDDECVINGQAKARASQLWTRYEEWAKRNGEDALGTQRKFGQAMTERGFERFKNNGAWYRGVGLRDDRA